MGLAQMQAGIGQAPEEIRPALELVIKKIQERISLLEAEKGE